MIVSSLTYVKPKAINVALVDNSLKYEAITSFMKANFRVDYINATTTVYADYDSKHRWFDEATIVAGEFRSQLTKIFGDSVTVIDTFYYNYDSPVDEFTSISEQTTFDLAKILADTSSIAEEIALNLEKPFSDATGASTDQSDWSFTQRNLETTTPSETFARQVDFTRELPETATPSEIYNTSLTKPLADATSATTDSISATLSVAGSGGVNGLELNKVPINGSILEKVI